MRARMQALNVVQWLARIANSYVDDALASKRVLLSYRPAQRVFVTQPFRGNLAVEMHLPSLKLQFLEDGKPVPHVFDPQERSPAELEAWVLVELLHRGVDRSRFSKALPYVIPGLITGDAEDYAPDSCRSGLEELSCWFDNAAAVIDAFRAKLGGGTAVCWPETLELRFRGPSDQTVEVIFSSWQDDARGPSFSAGRIDGPRTILEASELATAGDPFATAHAFMNAAVR